ncbi:MAG: hypothetical protein MJ252_02170 [archaeon]|nr:hypothetical protein [archaeon]
MNTNYGDFGGFGGFGGFEADLNKNDSVNIPSSSVIQHDDPNKGFNPYANDFNLEPPKEGETEGNPDDIQKKINDDFPH